MKKCPFCAEMIQDEATKCRFCGEFLDNSLAEFKESQSQPIPAARLAEIRRLQRIASGRPTKADRSRKSRGLMYLAIISLILFYSWHWRSSQQNTNPISASIRSEISLEAFSTIFGSGSPLSQTSKIEEFQNFKGKVVTWTGAVVYLNRGSGAKPFVTIRQNTAAGITSVTVYLKKAASPSMDSLRVGQEIRFSGKIADYGHQSEFITLIAGAILADSDPN